MNMKTHFKAPLGRLFTRWESLTKHRVCSLLGVVGHRFLTVGVRSFFWPCDVGLGSQLRREFFPEVDAGAFEIYVRAKSGTRIEETEKRIAAVERVVREKIGEELEIVISASAVVADWSAAYTPNSGPMDAVVKVQLKPERDHSAQEFVNTLRQEFAGSTSFADLELAFDAGGMIRGAMNEGKSTPINIRITGKNLEKTSLVANAIRQRQDRRRGRLSHLAATRLS